jgi:hypothetical protein
MSAERKDVRAKLDERYHAAVVLICRQRGIEIGDYLEGLVVADVSRIAHDAIPIGNGLKELGFSGKVRE